MRKHLLILFFTFLSTISYSQIPCENGFAGDYPCNGVDLYAHIDNKTLSGMAGAEGNDIWGWTDQSTGKEYALMGQTNGTVFIDISDPLSPVIIGRLPSHTNFSSTWRDVKVYGDFAFVVADNNSGHGMQIFDLKKLRGATNTPIVFSEDAHYDGVSSAHNVVINEEKGLAYIVGARNASNNCGAGGLHIVDISTPTTPVFKGCFDADGYTHDSQVVTYHGPDTTYQGKQIAFNSNENTITIADVNDPEKTTLISKQGYAAAAYAHQGWLTEDHRYFISNDELDENNNLVSATRTLVWDVSSLERPTLLSAYKGNRFTIDHNLYTNLGLIYQSNYTSGLIILDGSEISENGALEEIAFFDTYPSDNNVSFNGSWSNYPYFESGLIIISDINRGLFIVKRSDHLQSILQQQPTAVYNNSGASLEIRGNKEVSITSFQWEIKTGVDSFTPLENNENYAGVNTSKLNISFSENSLDEKRYRCVLTTADENTFNSKVSNPIKLPFEAITNIEEVNSQEIAIYPNPAHAQLFIETKNTEKIKSFTIHTTAGTIIKEGKLEGNSILLSGIGAGLYILILKNSDNKSSYKRFIIE